MTYEELLLTLSECGYERVERDDRLLDVFPRENREKGVELWTLWQPTSVRILRVRLPYSESSLRLFELPRNKVEKLLLKNIRAELEVFQELARGEASARRL